MLLIFWTIVTHYPGYVNKQVQFSVKWGQVYKSISDSSSVKNIRIFKKSVKMLICLTWFDDKM